MENEKKATVFVVNFIYEFDRYEVKETKVFWDREKAENSASSWEEESFFKIATLNEVTVE